MQTEIAWAAGFFDGEGTVWKYEKTGRWRLQAEQNAREPLDRLVSALGGHVLGPYERKAGSLSKNPRYYWRVDRQSEVVRIARLLLRHSSVKSSALSAMLAEGGSS